MLKTLSLSLTARITFKLHFTQQGTDLISTTVELKIY